MQTIEMLKKRERVLALQIQLRLLSIRKQAQGMNMIIACYVRLPAGAYTNAWTYSIQGWQELVRSYETARDNGDLLLACRLTPCTADITKPADTVEGAVARIAKLDYERRGLAEVIGRIDEVIEGIEKRGPTSFLNYLDIKEKVEIERPSLDGQFFHRCPGGVWMSENRTILNRAYHEVCVKFGLKRLRQVVQHDIAGPNGLFDESDGTMKEDAEFGRILRRDYAKLLLERFLTNNPDQALVGTVSA